MKIRCIHNTGEALRIYENKPLAKNKLGKFGATGYTEFGLTIDKEYLVMGIIIFETYQAYLIDDNGFISVYPCQLFEIMDHKLTQNWYFRRVNMNEDIYPFIQAIFGYYELCFDKKAYTNLIVEKEEYSERIYFKRKIELEATLSEESAAP